MRNTKNLLTIQQAASMLNMKEARLKRIIREKKIKITNGDNGYIDKKMLRENFIASKENKGDKLVLNLMRNFLLKHADSIQKLATKEHKKYLGGDKFRSEYLDKYQGYHIKIIQEYANNLFHEDIKHGTEVFNKLGEKLATESVKDGLTIQEAVDGTIFLKQAIWKYMEKEGVMDLFPTEYFYKVSLTIGTYCDIIGSKIAFVYHDKFIKIIQKEKANAEKAVKIRDQFISAASHELKTPVTSLKVYTQGLEKQIQNGKKESTLKYFKKIDSQVNKLATLIEDLLNITKLQHGKLEFTMNGFNINELLTEAIEAIQGIDEKHKIILLGNVDRKVFGDKYRLYQVVTNLLTNAIKYSPKANKIVIWVVPKDDRVIIGVEDFGIGIGADQQKKIFDQFYRVAQYGAETFPGMGMGLFIANELIKRHGSEITVKSKKGKGSIFSFSLQYAEE